MKVTLPKDYQNKLTMAEYKRAKEIIKDMKDDESTVAEYAEYAINEYLKNKQDNINRVIEANAEICTYYRANDVFGEGSGKLDILITATARTYNGYIEITAQLSDIWQTGVIDYRDRMYVEYFTKDYR